MPTASSAHCTCKAFRSASEWTATVGIPISRQVLMILTAISPLLATIIFSNMTASLHAEQAVTLGSAVNGSVERGRDGQSQDVSCLCRIEDTVVPEIGRGVVGVALLFRHGDDRLLNRLDRFFGEGRLPLPRELIVFHGDEHVGRLFAAPDADLGVGPHPQDARRVGPAEQAVVAGP